MNTGSIKWKERVIGDCATERGRSIWNSKYAGMEAGSIHNDHVGSDRVIITLKNKKYIAHRICWEIVNGKIPKGMTVDHIDQNPLNNKIDNLRLATELEQKKNMPMNKNNSSGFTGVYWNKRTLKWDAKIGINRKTIFIGSANTKDEAHAMRLIAEKENNFHENHGKRFAANLRAGVKS